MNETIKVTGRILPISEATKRRNPELWSSGPVVARLRAEKPQSDQRSEGQDRELEQGKESFSYRITISVFRKRLLDNHDNARSALKPIVDLITTTLGFASDDCPELEWEYHQIKTSGSQGTLILISYQ
jgi:hypothetical protein